MHPAVESGSQLWHWRRHFPCKLTVEPGRVARGKPCGAGFACDHSEVSNTLSECVMHPRGRHGAVGERASDLGFGRARVVRVMQSSYLKLDRFSRYQSAAGCVVRSSPRGRRRVFRRIVFGMEFGQSLLMSI